MRFLAAVCLLGGCPDMIRTPNAPNERRNPFLPRRFFPVSCLWLRGFGEFVPFSTFPRGFVRLLGFELLTGGDGFFTYHTSSKLCCCFWAPGAFLLLANPRRGMMFPGWFSLAFSLAPFLVSTFLCGGSGSPALTALPRCFWGGGLPGPRLLQIPVGLRFFFCSLFLRIRGKGPSVLLFVTRVAPPAFNLFAMLWQRWFYFFEFSFFSDTPRLVLVSC